MRFLVYGCSQRIKDMIKNIITDTKMIDFTDSNPAKWNKEVMHGKSIIPPHSIEPKSYSFCLIGSEKYQEEIRRNCISLGFPENIIVPVSFIVSQYERENKIYFIDEWKPTVEKKGISIVTNWHTQDNNMDCIIRIDNCLWNDLEISFMCLVSDRLDICIEDIITNQTIDYSNASGEKIVYRIKSNKELIRLRVKNCAYDVPWVSLDVCISELHTMLYRQKRVRPFVDAFEMMRGFYFHEEDYLAVKGFCNKGTIIDLGANYGQSMYAFYHLTNSNIVSVEVVPELYDILQIFKGSFDLENRVEVINIGISDGAGELMWYDPGPLLSGSFDKDFLYSIGVRAELTQKYLPCNSMDNVFANLNDVWLIKMDIEGLECKALQGASALIERNFPIICIEENQHKMEIVELLQNYYELYYYSPSENLFINHQELGVNYWLIPKEEYRKNMIKEFLEEKLVY